MKHLLALVLILAGCGAPDRVDTAKDVLNTARESAVALYQVIGGICDAREQLVVDRVGSTEEVDRSDLNQIREECGAVLKPLLDAIEGVEVVEIAIDIPWVREAL
jgi:hypothetical protein